MKSSFESALVLLLEQIAALRLEIQFLRRMIVRSGSCQDERLAPMPPPRRVVDENLSRREQVGKALP